MNVAALEKCLQPRRIQWEALAQFEALLRPIAVHAKELQTNRPGAIAFSFLFNILLEIKYSRHPD
jgi:hypothetical protein